MKRKRKLLISLLLVAIMVGLYGYREYNRTNKDLLHEAPAVYVSAATLIAAYEKDTAAFHQKYSDKVLAVHGKVKRIDATENPAVFSIGEDGLSSVQCSMDSTHAALYKHMKEGETAIIKGIFTGARTDEMFGTDVILNRCVPEVKN